MMEIDAIDNNIEQSQETTEAPPFDVNSKTATVDGTKIPIESGDPNASSGY